MVRPDHEDGRTLNPAEETPAGETAGEETGAVAASGAASIPSTVQRSSPIGGRRKKARPSSPATPAVESEPGTGEAADAAGGASDDQTSDDQISLRKPGGAAAEPSVGESSAAEPEPDADEVARSAVYRERRRNRAVIRTSAGQQAAAGNSKLVILAVSLTALVVIVGAVLSAVFGYQYHKIEQQRELRAEYSAFAQQMVVSMSTLNPDNADQMYKNAMDKTSGRAKQMFSENMKQVAEMVRKGDMVTKTTIVADAVAKSDPDEGSVLVVYAWEGHPKNDAKNTDFATFRARVDITRINGELKMTYFDWVA